MFILMLVSQSPSLLPQTRCQPIIDCFSQPISNCCDINQFPTIPYNIYNIICNIICVSLRISVYLHICYCERGTAVVTHSWTITVTFQVGLRKVWLFKKWVPWSSYFTLILPFKCLFLIILKRTVAHRFIPVIILDAEFHSISVQTKYSTV